MSFPDKNMVDLDSHQGFRSELQFWDQELSLKGDYPDSILNRLQPERMKNQFPFYIMPLIEELTRKCSSPPKVLDVGSGPLSMLAYGAYNKLLELTCVDPLADRYKELLAKHGYKATSTLVKGFGERLSAVFGTETFHMAWIHNALDHTQYPVVVLKEMVSVLKPYGYLILQGWSREGTAEGWIGLHQHDIYLLSGGRLMCESRGAQDESSLSVCCINEGLPVELVEWSEPTSEVKKWIRVIYRKLGP